MKTNYWLILIAAGAAVGLTVYLRLSGEKSVRPMPPRVAAVRHHVRELELPPPAPAPTESTAEPLVNPVVEASLRPPPPAVPPLPVPVPPLSTKPQPSPVPPILPISATESPASPTLPGFMPEPKIPLMPETERHPRPTLPAANSELPLLPEPPVSPGALSSGTESVTVPKLPVPPSAGAATVSAPQPPQPPTAGDARGLPKASTPPLSPEPAIPPMIPGPIVDDPRPAVMPPPGLQPLPAPKPLPNPSPTSPTPPAAPTPLPAPVLQPPVSPHAPPTGSPASPPDWSANGRFVVLSDNKLIEGSQVSVAGNSVVVRQGALDRTFPKSQVQFVGASKDDVYQFMLAKVPADDPAARLKVAQWCMFAGLREQALREAREVMKLKPDYRAAADLARSLERSLREFPPAELPKMAPPTTPAFPTELKPLPPPIPPAVSDSDWEITPEAVKTFPRQVQPFLANQCVSCHAKSDYPGAFKLARVAPDDAPPLATQTNLRAVVGQIDWTNPQKSPLLLKSLTAHGGQRRPAIDHREEAVFQTLESWIIFAVGRSNSAVAEPVAEPLLIPGANPQPGSPMMPTIPHPPEHAEPPVPPLEIPATPLLPPPGIPTGEVPPKPVLPPSPAAPPGDVKAEPTIPPPGIPAVPPLEPPPPSIPVPVVPLPQPLPPVPPIPGSPTPGEANTPRSSQPPRGEGGTLPPPQPATSGQRGDEFDPEPFNKAR